MQQPFYMSVLACSFTAAILAGIGLIMEGWRLNAAEWAAWVQALGSVFAIMAAIYIAKDGRVVADKARIVGAFNAAVLAASLVQVAVESARDLSKARQWNALLVQLTLREFRAAQEMIARVNTADLPGQVVAAMLIRVVRASHKAEVAVATIEALLSSGKDAPERSFEELVAEIQHCNTIIDAEGSNWINTKFR